MTRKKNGFLTFCFSLIPGAGEMYMGFFKQGISIMVLFWGLIALSSWLNIGPVMFVAPIIWCYSLFHTWNLRSLSDEEFYAVEDNYLFAENSDNIKDFFNGKKGRRNIAIILIVVGVLTAWNILTDVMDSFLNLFGWNNGLFYTITDGVPQLAVAVILIVGGIYLIKGKKQELDQEETQKTTKEEVIDSEIVNETKVEQ